jgi:HD-GYP domain-containing protein (c-di-GMP phosphodiesterase class II)
MRLSSMNPAPYFVVDPEWEYLLALKAEQAARAVPPVVCTDLATGLVEFSKREASYSALFVNPAVDESHGINLIKLVVKLHPATPIFYLTEPEFPILPDNELEKLTVRKVLLKPLRFPQMIKAVQDAQLAFDPTDTIKKGSRKDKVDQEAQADDTDFLPISATKFVSGSSCFFDVYVRLRASRFVKILQAGDAFSPDRVQSYRDKGVENFYLRKEAQEAYLKYCDKLTAQVLKKEGLAPSVKIAVLANHGAEVLSFLKHQNLDAAAIGHAEKFSDNVKAFAAQLKGDKIKTFLDDASAMEHGAGITMVASFLLKPLKLETDKSVHLLGLASLFHDIGLQGMDPKLKDEDEHCFSPEELVLYKTHPDKGVAALSGVGGVDPVVLQAVWQHHERRTRDGFPQRIGSGATNRLAEMVGISDEYLKMIRELNQGKRVNQRFWLENSIIRGFSPQMVEAFRAAFKL